MKWDRGLEDIPSFSGLCSEFQPVQYNQASIKWEILDGVPGLCSINSLLSGLAVNDIDAYI